MALSILKKRFAIKGAVTNVVINCYKRYLKSGTAKTKSQRKNYTKYIATRESVEVREQSKKIFYGESEKATE